MTTKTKADLETENAQLREENEALRKSAEAESAGEKTKAELQAENTQLKEENEQLRTAKADRAMETAADNAVPGQCPNCGFDPEAHKDLVTAAAARPGQK